ncbi:hypothetical protein M885DRAFT_539254, partial [Pelagophyceae sp. CCMP2097]
QDPSPGRRGASKEAHRGPQCLGGGVASRAGRGPEDGRRGLWRRSVRIRTCPS